MHTVGQSWISLHKSSAGNGGYTKCAYCHGADYKGSPLSTIATARSFSAGDSGNKSFAVGHQMNCYDCHNGPRGE